jgi:hypothetical protein
MTGRGFREDNGANCDKPKVDREMTQIRLVIS